MRGARTSFEMSRRASPRLSMLYVQYVQERGGKGAGLQAERIEALEEWSQDVTEE
jgi:hypothetical protein